MKVVRVYAIVMGALALPSCTPDWAKTGNADVQFLMTAINAGIPIQSDVRDGEGATPPLSIVCSDFVALRLENHFINPNLTTTGFRHDFTVFRYTVQYARSDGLGTEGVDVPFSISGNLAQEVTEENSVTLNLEVVRAQAKLEPPLNNLARNGGSVIITVFATVTLYARTTTGDLLNPVSAQVQIDFADFSDTLTACPTAPAA